MCKSVKITRRRVRGATIFWGTPGMAPDPTARAKIVLYVLCYDDDSRRIAEASFGHLPFAKIVHIPSGMWLENIVYTWLLPRRREEWRDATYVGCIAYKGQSKLSMGVDDIPEVCDMLRHTGDAEVIPLCARPLRQVLVSHASRCHPHFLSIWTRLLSEMGYCEEDILSPDMPEFFCQYFLATPAAMDAYVEFFVRARRVFETADFQEELWSDGNYPTGKMPPERLMQLFGTPHYPHLPFVCERLPCFFFWKHGYRVCAF